VPGNPAKRAALAQQKAAGIQAAQPAVEPNVAANFELPPDLVKMLHEQEQRRG
jgi:hypothetical protein